MTRVLIIVAVALGVSWWLWSSPPPEARKPSTRKHTSYLQLDGKREQVRWSDGDTFRILRGPRRGVKARLQGFNTLEAYGPVHRWGQWAGRQLIANADQATAFVRQDGWKCQSQGKQDRYKRLLVACPGLAKRLISLGLAHIFGPPKGKQSGLLSLQRKAILGKRGMWAKGAPAYLLTSVHSSDEGKRQPYNRFVSTKDGSFVIQRHNNKYKTCQWVCARGSCLLYVPYARRYGASQPACLR